jgi:hypothetical protein
VTSKTHAEHEWPYTVYDKVVIGRRGVEAGLNHGRVRIETVECLPDEFVHGGEKASVS